MRLPQLKSARARGRGHAPALLAPRASRTGRVCIGQRVRFGCGSASPIRLRCGRSRCCVVRDVDGEWRDGVGRARGRNRQISNPPRAPTGRVEASDGLDRGAASMAAATGHRRDRICPDGDLCPIGAPVYGDARRAWLRQASDPDSPDSLADRARRVLLQLVGAAVSPDLGADLRDAEHGPRVLCGPHRVRAGVSECCGPGILACPRASTRVVCGLPRGRTHCGGAVDDDRWAGDDRRRRVSRVRLGGPGDAPGAARAERSARHPRARRGRGRFLRPNAVCRAGTDTAAGDGRLRAIALGLCPRSAWAAACRCGGPAEELYSPSSALVRVRTRVDRSPRGRPDGLVT